MQYLEYTARSPTRTLPPGATKPLRQAPAHATYKISCLRATRHRWQKRTPPFRVFVAARVIRQSHSFTGTDSGIKYV